MRRERKPPLRMIRRAQAVKFPDGARQNAVRKFIALAPPAIPDAAQIGVRTFLRPGQFHRQQAADAEQSRLKCKWRFGAARPEQTRFRQILHRPGVVFVAERAEQALPQGLFPAGVPRPRGKLRGLGLQTDASGLAQKLRRVAVRQVRATTRNICRADFRERRRRIRFRATGSIRRAARRENHLSAKSWDVRFVPGRRLALRFPKRRAG